MDGLSSNSCAGELQPALSDQDRRRSLRCRPSPPSYAVGDTLVSGRVAELNEILDVSEYGMGLQALWPLKVGHTAEFRLK
jgi:hypothetical protein